MTAKKTNAGSGKIHLKWVRSAICAPQKQKLVIKGLGFTRLNQVIERPDAGHPWDGCENATWLK
jgi:ribosomal protein L30/L7E